MDDVKQNKIKQLEDLVFIVCDKFTLVMVVTHLWAAGSWSDKQQKSMLVNNIQQLTPWCSLKMTVTFTNIKS